MPEQSTAHSLWLETQQIFNQVEEIYQEATSALDLSVVEWHILQALFSQDGQSAGGLARSVGKPATSFTPILDKLVAKGWITRRPDSIDRRAVRIHLTDQAERQREKLEASAVLLEGLLEERVSSRDMAFVRELAERLQAVAIPADVF